MAIECPKLRDGPMSRADRSFPALAMIEVQSKLPSSKMIVTGGAVEVVHLRVGAPQQNWRNAPSLQVGITMLSWIPRSGSAIIATT